MKSNRLSTVLTLSEAQTFLRAAAGDRLESLFVPSLRLRQGEAFGLTGDRVHLEEGWLYIERTLQRYSGAYHLDEVKTTRSRRLLGRPGNCVRPYEPTEPDGSKSASLLVLPRTS